MKVAGAMTANITPSPRHGLDESLEELERQLLEAAMLRDGGNQGDNRGDLDGRIAEQGEHLAQQVRHIRPQRNG